MHIILDKYITKLYYKNLLFTIFTFLTIFISIDIIEKLDLFIDSEISSNEILKFYILSIPSFFHISLPMSVLITTIFTLGTLIRDNEIEPIIMSGTRTFRIYISILVSGLFISIASFFIEDNFVIKSQNMRNEIQKKYSFEKKSKNKNKIEPTFFRLPNNRILIIKNYDYANKKAHSISIQHFDNEKIIDRIDASAMFFVKETNSWNLPKHERRTLNNGKHSYNFVETDTTIDLGTFLSDTLRLLQKPELMNYNQLGLFISDFEESGNKNPRWDVNHKFRISFASTSFIMTLFGVGIALNRRNRNIAVNIGIGILSIFAYYVTIKFFQTLGYYGTLESLEAVWIPNILFLFIGFYLVRRIQT